MFSIWVFCISSPFFFLSFGFKWLVSLWWELEKIREYSPRASTKTLWEYYPKQCGHHYGAEPSFHRSALRYNAAPVLITAYITAWTHLRPLILPFVHRKDGTPNILTHGSKLLILLPALFRSPSNRLKIIFCAVVTNPSTHKMNGIINCWSLRKEILFCVICRYN